MKQLIFLLFITQFGFCQTKIYLTSPKGHQDDYHFVKASDSVYIQMTHREDMGVHYSHSYKFKPTAPDGDYEIYTDNVIELKATLKDHKKEGTLKTFYDNGAIQSNKEYKNDEINGKVIDYYKSGKIKYECGCINDKPAIGIQYYESGKIQAKNYFIDGDFVKQEVYTEEGKLQYVSDPQKGIIKKME